jgi:hypothetical protein
VIGNTAVDAKIVSFAVTHMISLILVAKINLGPLQT